MTNSRLVSEINQVAEYLTSSEENLNNKEDEVGPVPVILTLKWMKLNPR